MKGLELEEGDKVYLDISHMNGLVRFDIKGKFSPCYVGLYVILQRVGKVF